MEYVIRTEGELVNSPYYNRRKFYISFTENGVPVDLEKAVDILGKVLDDLELEIDAYDFPNDKPWWKVLTCPYCRKQAEQIVVRHGCLPSNWRSRYCLRHGLVQFLYDIGVVNVIDNKDREYKLLVNGTSGVLEEISIMLATNKHEVKYYINVVKQYAEVVWNDRIKFTYKMHFRAYPLRPAYLELLDNVAYLLGALLSVLEKNPPIEVNIIYNGETIYTAKEESQENCPKCRLPRLPQ